MNMNQKESARIDFAGMALQGLLANGIYMNNMGRKLISAGKEEGSELAKAIAKDAVEFADALIAELEKGGRKCCG